MYSRYIRKNIDNNKEPLENDIWSENKRGIADLSTFRLYAGYFGDFNIPIFFCSKALQISIGQMSIVYSASEKPCYLKGWEQKFYLYGTAAIKENVKKLYVGVSSREPHNSRIKFKTFPFNYQSADNFYFYAYSLDFIPDNDVSHHFFNFNFLYKSCYF